MIRNVFRSASLLAALTALSACTMLLGDFDNNGSGGSTHSGTTSTGQTGGTGTTSSTSDTGGTAGTGGTGGTTVCTSGGTSCGTPADCPATGQECVEATCVQGCCGTQKTPALSPAATQKVGDCRQTVCDGNGGTQVVIDDTDVDPTVDECNDFGCDQGGITKTPKAGPCATGVCGDVGTLVAGTCVACNVGTDCPSGICQANLCVPPACDDTVKNGSETDKDCGGACSPCANGLLCGNGADCQSKVCDVTGHCAAPTCGDGTTNGAESDKDCGGTCPVKCAAGLACNAGTDCFAGVCAGGMCANPTCFDNAKNGSETDKDCGGSCSAKCGTGLGCGNAGDCQSGVCAAAICAAPGCGDGVKNGAETDKDCGGATTCARCGVGQICAQASDCLSGVCAGGACSAPSCTDNVKNGAETDKDCGGPTCGDCANGLKCALASDCQSGVCTGGVCQIASCGDGVANGGETDKDCGGTTTCNRCGVGLICTVAGDCQSGVCTSGHCSVAGCTDGVKNGTETDKDCGGASCPKCVAGLICTVASDCQSGVCTGGICRAATCSDVVKNALETDVDCGGGTCPTCVTGKICVAGSDCQSGVCTGGLCKAPTCSDTVKNAAETDVDCGGGTCGACAAGKSCAAASDCQSGVCTGGKCQAVSCTDLVKNGAETDTDCGGGTCPKCNDALKCVANTDCKSALCSGGVCVSCADGAKNGAETDVDCGGASCSGCALGKACVAGSDCQSAICVGGKCATCTPGQTRCTGSTPQTCDAAGNWVSGAACGAAAPVCCQGACVATVAEVSVGGQHTCARKTDGTLWCWGSDVYGQIGDGSTTSPKSTVQVSTLGSSVAQVAAGGVHTCARKTDGTLWCWGNNGNGQLGDGTTTQRTSPVQVTSLGTSVASVAVGYAFTCAVKTDGTLWCWGHNGLGQLGDGTTTQRVLPVQVTTLGAGVAQASLGYYHGCARKTDGTVWCWGYNGYGQVGDNSTTLRKLPVQVTSLGAVVAQVSVGHWHSCARRTDGALYCWGYNYGGQVGDGTTVQRNVPTNVTTFGTTVTQVGAGGDHTCAIRNDGTTWCWGGNGAYQIGDGTNLPRALPVQATGLGTGASAVSVGGSASCARKGDGTLWCWGDDSTGMIGYGYPLPYIAVPARLSLGVCSSDTCNNSAKDTSESDVDCGGTCLADGLVCQNGKQCSGNGDCAVTSICQSSHCVDTCADGVIDFGETDVDCGGGTRCGGCEDGKKCTAGSDCAGGGCNNGICYTLTCLPDGYSCSQDGDCCGGLCCGICDPAC